MKQRTLVITAAVLLCLTLLSTSLTCGMYARYTTAGTSSDQARAAKFGQLTLDLEAPQGGMLMPGQTKSTTLNPMVSMTESEVAVVVYVYVTLPKDSGWEYDQARRSFTCGEILWTVAEGWTYLEEKDKTYTFYQILPPGERLSKKPVVMDGTMKVPQEYDHYYDLSASDVNLHITFKAKAAQID